MFSTNNNSEIENDQAYTMFGECRCCLAKGRHRDVTKEYYYNNIKEVYKDIFLECFNLTLSPHNLISCLICDSCVHRLRDATSFRMMVVATEDQLLKAVVFKSDPDPDFIDVTGPSNFTTEVKIESENMDDEPRADSSSEGELMIDEDRDNEYIDNESDIELIDNESIDNEFTDNVSIDTEYTDNVSIDTEYTDNVSTDNESTDYETDYFDDCVSTCSSITLSSTSSMDDEPLEIIDGEEKLLARFPKSVQPLPRRWELSNVCPEYDEHVRKIEDKLVKTTSLKWFLDTEKEEKVVTDRIALALNATTIFENSNATAFKTKRRNVYSCYYCQEVYKYDKIKEHQEKHDKASIYNMLLKYNPDEFVVYADITDLKCKICKKRIRNLKLLQTHLTVRHEKKIYPSADKIIPFKLKETDFACTLCGKKTFDTFGAVEKHMNVHFAKFTCENCGNDFITKHRLAVHNYSQHKNEKVTCKICKKSFRSQMKYRLHCDGVHKSMKKFKCAKCSEKFVDYFSRQKHMVDAHSEAPLLYKCSVCEKGFTRRYGLATHVKRCHRAEKNIKCEKCSYKCYTNSELRDHMHKHGSKKKFECTMCDRKYSRNRSLMSHLKTHQ